VPSTSKPLALEPATRFCSVCTDARKKFLALGIDGEGRLTRSTQWKPALALARVRYI